MEEKQKPVVVKIKLSWRLVIYVLLAVMFATNPKVEDHQEAVKIEAARLLSLNPENTWVDMLGTQGAKMVVSSKNYYIFSLTQVDGLTIGFGMFTGVDIFTEKLITKIDEL